MKNIVDFINESNQFQSVLPETQELIDILKNNDWTDAGLTLAQAKEKFANSYDFSAGQINKLFKLNKFKSDKNMKYMIGYNAPGTMDFSDYVSNEVGTDADAEIIKGSYNEPDYSASAFMTDNIFIVWGGSCIGDDNSILIVSDSF